jgi:hypothetical protein
LLDPQFYLPHADHERLCSHEYWPQEYETGAFFQGPALTKLLRKLRELNVRLGCRAFILPGLLAASVDDDWLAIQRAIIEEGQAKEKQFSLIATIALSAEAVKDEEQIALLLEAAEQWSVQGYYIVCEHPNGQYLVTEPNWVANVIDLAAGLRLRGAEVVLGYCNHQMLIAALAKVNAIASGTWMNVRSFPPDKFKAPYEEEIKQRATWYYCAQALSEYKIPFLDIAKRQKVLSLMARRATLMADLSPRSLVESNRRRYRLVNRRHFGIICTACVDNAQVRRGRASTRPWLIRNSCSTMQKAYCSALRPPESAVNCAISGRSLM